ncbi:MAG: exodeoxyribonuclease VII large subunit, partial [Bacteroidales bacterium]|nr:exodeoxyribonuclease VII large subunit [Bacteroidales bacterium]
MEQDYLELLELQTLIREGIEDAMPGPVRVRAEIASLQRRSNGHCYLELCESGPRGPVAKVRAVIWRSAWDPVAGKFARETGEPLREGLALVFEVTVNYSELYGLTLIIEDIDVSHTLGEAELARRRTIEKLTEEGLMDLQKELALPDLPYEIAVISAPDAAGYGDFRRHLLENEYGFAFNVTLFEAAMQGETAPASIMDAMQRALDAGGFDAVLVMRGGGSTLDLACFDDYALCAAIARYPVPVYTAIGHDRDVHVADMVACGSVKTPTALADLLVDAVAAEDERISA